MNYRFLSNQTKTPP